MPPVDVPTYDQAYGQLASIYDPQTTSVNTQIAGLQPLQDAQQSGLDQAKVNAFRDITQGANAKGVMFSGVPIDQQATYVGTKYLPAVANLKQTFANQRTTLLDKINQINAQRATQAQGIVSDAQKNAADAYYKQQQLGLSYAKLSASNARASAGKAPTQAEILQQDMATTAHNLSSKMGKDNHVSQTTWNQALNDWVNAGYSAKDFIANNIRFVNQRYNGYQGIGKQNAIGQWG